MHSQYNIAFCMLCPIITQFTKLIEELFLLFVCSLHTGIGQSPCCSSAPATEVEQFCKILSVVRKEYNALFLNLAHAGARFYLSLCVCVCFCVSVTALASATNALKAKVRYQQKVLDSGNKTSVLQGRSHENLSGQVILPQHSGIA